MSGSPLESLWLRLLPAGLRLRHGAEIVETSRALLARERALHGRRAGVALSLRLTLDFVRVALARGGADARASIARTPSTPTAGRPRPGGRRSMFDGLVQDLHDSWRGARRSPGHAAAVVVTLALGVGANAAIFAVVHSVLIEPLPFREPDRLVLLAEANPERGWDGVQVAPANLLDWGERAKGLESVAGFSDWFDHQTISAPGDPQPVKTMRVAGDLFGTLGVKPLIGRAPSAEETWAGREEVAVLSYRLWATRFAGDRALVGRTIEIDRAPVRVIGVMPERFSLWSEETDLWRPFGWKPDSRSATWFRRAHFVRGIGRLAPGTTLAAAREELAAIARGLEREHPDTNRLMGSRALPLRDWLVGDLRRPLLLLLVAVAMVLLIACANVTHLQLARALARERELALRGSLGASPWQLARRGLVDSVLLSAAGALAGFGLAWAVSPWLLRLGGDDLARLGTVELGPTVLLFAFVLSLTAALVSGALPAFQARSTKLERLLRETGRAGESRRRGAFRWLLVAAEVAFGIVLAAGALFLVRSLLALERVSPGFDPRGVLVAELALPPLAYPDENAINTFSRRLVERVHAIPGVESVALANRLPLTGDSWSSDFSVEGRAAERFGIDVLHREVSEEYFAALRVPLHAGRLFGPGDDRSAPNVVVINRALARRYFGDLDPVGLRICFDRVPDADSTWRTIVGVVGDERQTAVAREARPEILAPVAQDPNAGPRLVVRSALAPEQLVPALRAALSELDPRLPLFGVRAMDDLVADSKTRERFVLRLFGSFALLALALAVVGVYGVAAHAAAGRRREIGVRLALGALPREAIAALVARSSAAVLAGGVVGVGGALALGRAMSGLLYDVSPGDPATLATAAAALLATAAVANWMPARRALRVDPGEVLRAE